MGTQNSPGLFLLLEDYSKSVERRISKSPSALLGPSNRPLWLETRTFPHRLRWVLAHRPDGGVVPPAATPLPRLLADEFDPIGRYRESPGSGVWPADDSTSLRLQTDWSSRLPYGWLLAPVAHALILGFLLIPATLQLETTKPADWDAMRITLTIPSLDDLPPLHGESKVPGDGDGGFRGLPQPPSDPVPGPAPIPEPVPAPEAASVQQPVEPPEPALETEETPALEPAEVPKVEELLAAQSPDPGEFRKGTELARARDPRLLPMPAAPSRKRAALQLESPKARMPGLQGDARLGSLELTTRPDQVVRGAIQNMIQGGGVRQAVGDGIGGPPSVGVLPSGPSNSGSAVELLSDPRGVDFRPYLTQVLAAVRRNWFAVIPESARMGMTRGRTLIQFSVARNGSVPKLVIAKSSGTPPLDRAAVAGISASNPFPPLPQEYLGQDIRLQFTFLYNIGTR